MLSAYVFPLLGRHSAGRSHISFKFHSITASRDTLTRLSTMQSVLAGGVLCLKLSGLRLDARFTLMMREFILDLMRCALDLAFSPLERPWYLQSPS